ncbi:HK97-gp10 family putative phage morphogenesis protein [Sphingomonas montanisoli]|uniref:HK97 gp10 family phage protein n=1 Tax=Sphingomonas montanisoli TaxID=2606412 RepID=A0A5D9C2U3_9SPHN|nr:HK97-gp10 family putative phage morphogenesis protein [Sphingomonas montanisoli]TZG25582.1 HK97 gp10 family phage protein [Sphingomonas montanisoli]
MAKVTGVDAVKRRLNSITGPEAVRLMGQALYVAGDLIATDAAISITAGAVSGKGHVASRPGEAPNADTHRLDRSIETVLVGPLHVQVSANAPYAAALEFGTSKVAERPFMRPSVAKNRDEVRQMVGDAVSAVVRRNGGK